MIPRALPKLAADAVRNRWDVVIDHDQFYRSGSAVMAHFNHRETEVSFVWEAATGRLVVSAINGDPTPYQQCTRLIRSPEGA